MRSIKEHCSYRWSDRRGYHRCQLVGKPRGSCRWLSILIESITLLMALLFENLFAYVAWRVAPFFEWLYGFILVWKPKLLPHGYIYIMASWIYIYIYAWNHIYLYTWNHIYVCAWNHMFVHQTQACMKPWIFVDGFTCIYLHVYGYSYRICVHVCVRILPKWVCMISWLIVVSACQYIYIGII